MSGETLSQVETEVYLRLRRHRVQKHYRASTEAGATRYAVFLNAQQVTEPKPFAQAKADCDTIIAKDIAAALAKAGATS